ncbi:TetR/AcrR family transcriptional regulator [Subtercola lobariae]|uniref:HTH tetR-type domain-containing protein n=1 Tax=Subtercola lobariae TaxID=1588641 RepID=A0A917B657_9MICO|nr:TetR/AcrR family transcriptional regulator [Subtercola lobariae]GGF22755.1 hypothetical protein GCM10011399_15490 [Subtercola lobariae]
MALRDASSKTSTDRGDRSRKVILDVATKLMSARGYDGTSISAIATESGLPASSIYYHFSSKLGILTAIIERGSHRFLEGVSLAAFPPENSHRENVFELLERGQRGIEATPEFVQLQFVIMFNSPAGVVNAAVEQTRAEEREGLRVGLAAAYADLGETTAGVIASELVDFVGAAFDGIFVAGRPGSATTKANIRLLAEATDALAKSVLARN